MFNSLNLQIGWLNAGTDAEIEWQWNGGHVPSEILGDSLPLYVDMMYGKHVDGADEITKPAASGQSANGTETEASGTDISSWVSYDSTNGARFSLSAASAYRTAGASKAIPGFDVMDYGQEDYVFGSSSADARHGTDMFWMYLRRTSPFLQICSTIKQKVSEKIELLSGIPLVYFVLRYRRLLKYTVVFLLQKQV